MVIRSINDLTAAFIYPEFLAHSPADGAVPVPTGIIVDLFAAAFFTGFKVKSAVDCAAPADVKEQFALFRRQADGVVVEYLAGNHLENLLYPGTLPGWF